MIKAYKIALMTCLLFFINSLSAKIYYGLGVEKVKKKGLEFSIAQLDSEADFAVINSQVTGIGRRGQQFFSPTGKFIVDYISNGKKGPNQLVIYLADGLKEVMRVEVKRFARDQFMNFRLPIFNQDESIVALQVKESKKKNKINAYSLASGELLYSINLEKKGSLLGQSKTRSTFYTGGKSSIKGSAGLYVYKMDNGALIETYKEKKTHYTYYPKMLPDFFTQELSDQSTHQYTIFSLDADTGKKIFKQKLGNTKPVFAKVNEDDNFFYIAHKSGSPKKVNVSKFENNDLEWLASTDGELKPFHLTASHDGRKFIVASKSNMRLLDRDEADQIFKMKAPFDVATGFFSEDDSLVYLREGTGSEVGIVDFTNRKLIGDSGTGRASVKFGQFMATVALAAATGGISGGSYIGIAYYLSDTAMLLSRDQQKLYVVNAKTNDVTIFNAKDLSGKKGVATGKNTFGVFQLKEAYFPDEKDSNVVVFSPKSASYFNSESTEIIKQVNFKEFLNADFEENIFFAKAKSDAVQAYRMSTGELIKTIENSDNIKSISYQTEK